MRLQDQRPACEPGGVPQEARELQHPLEGKELPRLPGMYRVRECAHTGVSRRVRAHSLQQLVYGAHKMDSNACCPNISLQGDVESIAAMSPKNLTSLFEEISGYVSACFRVCCRVHAWPSGSECRPPMLSLTAYRFRVHAWPHGFVWLRASPPLVCVSRTARPGRSGRLCAEHVSIFISPRIAGLER